MSLETNVASCPLLTGALIAALPRATAMSSRTSMRWPPRRWWSFASTARATTSASCHTRTDDRVAHKVGPRRTPTTWQSNMHSNDTSGGRLRELHGMNRLPDRRVARPRTISGLSRALNSSCA